MTLALGYASINSLAKAHAGQSHTACNHQHSGSFCFIQFYPFLSSYLAIPKQLIPFLPSEFSNSVVFGGEGIVPHQAIGGVLDTGGHHVVGLDIS